MNPKKFTSVMALAGPARYDYSIKAIADAGGAWGLYKDGWALAGSTDGEVFPIWPNAEFAGLCAVGDWSSAKPRSIDIKTLVMVLLPKLKSENVLIGIFPTRNETGVIPEIDLFLGDLKAECSRIIS